MRKLIHNLADYIRETDKLLLLICVTASLYGSALVYSATYYTGSSRQFLVQLASVFIGVITAVIISLFDYKNICKGVPVYIVISVILLIYTYLFGYAPIGSENKAWIELPFGMSFQASELIKISLILSFAKHVSVLDSSEINRPINILLLSLHGISPAVVIMAVQKDMGTSIILGCVFLAMLFAAGIKARYFVIGGVAAALLAPIIWFFGLSTFQRERFMILFDLESDPLGKGYQQLQGLRAIGAGGLTGYGFLKGPKTQSAAVPKAYNDFIFASAGEELGLIGSLVILILLLAIVLRVLKVSSLSRDKKGSIICVGVFAMLSAQAVINLGMCLAILPVIGVTLPFISAGGTSLVCLYIGIGLVLSVYKNRNKRVLYLRDS